MNKTLLSLSLLASFSFAADSCSGLYNAGEFKKSSDCYINQLKSNDSMANNYFAGDSLFQQGKYKEALPYLKKSEDTATSDKDLNFIYNTLSLCYSYLGDRELELSYDMKVLNLSLKSDNKANIGAAYSNLGMYYQNLNNTDKSQEFYLKSLDYLPELAKGNTYNNLGLLYSDLSQIDKAESYFKKAIDIDIKAGNAADLCNAKTNFGTLLLESDKLSEAKKTLLEANSICHKANYLSIEANSFVFLGFSAIKEKNLSLAKSYYDKAFPLANKSGDATVLDNLNLLLELLNKKG